MSDPEQPDRPMITRADVIAAYREMRRMETALAAHDLSVFQLALLATIADAPGVSIGISVQAIGVSSAIATGGVDRLEKRGLVMRRTSFAAGKPRDRRQVLVDVTERGRETLAALATIALSPLDDLVIGDAS